MIQEIVKQFLNSSQGSDVSSQLNQEEGLSPDRVEEAVQATAEGAMKHGGAAGLDLSGLLGGAGGGLGALTGAIGGITGGGGSKTALDGGALSKLTGPVTQFVVQKGFPPGVAEKVVRAVLPKLLELVRKH